VLSGAQSSVISYDPVSPVLSSTGRPASLVRNSAKRSIDTLAVTVIAAGRCYDSDADAAGRFTTGGFDNAFAAIGIVVKTPTAKSAHPAALR
jgi:hypothetical protein